MKRRGGTLGHAAWGGHLGSRQLVWNELERLGLRAAEVECVLNELYDPKCRRLDFEGCVRTPLFVIVPGDHVRMSDELADCVDALETRLVLEGKLGTG